MRIDVKLGAGLRARFPGQQGGLLAVDLPEDAMVSQALSQLGLDGDQVRVLMLNGRALHQDRVLQPGDRLALFGREQAFNVMTAMSFFNPLARAAAEDDQS